VPELLRLQARAGRVDLLEPFVISRGVEHWYDVVEVSVTWEGATGWGEATPIDYYGETAGTVVDYVRRWDGRLGDDPFALDEVTGRLAEEPGDRAAQAGIDAALHDLCGRLVGLPAWRLLGTPRTGPPTARTISLADPATMAAAARREAAAGYRLLKLKLGGRDGRDLERVRAVREQTDLPMIVDVNEYWTLTEALDLIPRLADLGVTHVEQPLRAADPDASILKDRSPLPLVADEDCHTLADVAACAERAHGINVKLAKSGGIREALRMIHAARALDLIVMVGCMGESSLGIAAHTVVAGLCDLVDLDGNLGLAGDPWSGVALVDGVQVPSADAGLGVRRCA